jgi:hypothetical protein
MITRPTATVSLLLALSATLVPTFGEWFGGGEPTQAPAVEPGEVGRAAAMDPENRPTRSVSEQATEIDRLLEAHLREQGLRPNETVDDATFVRRAYLSILGRIPTILEMREWTQSSGANKRTKLVDRLLDSPGRVGHDFHWWADLLRIKTPGLGGQVSGEPYAAWMRDVIRDNVAYDEIVRSLVTADGPAHARGGGPVGYRLRDRGMPEDNMANTARVFLGTRLECAQCHDHPFDRWKQKEFFELCAFTGGVIERFDARTAEKMGVEVAWLKGKGGFQGVRQAVRAEYGDNGQRALGRMLRTFGAGVTGNGKGVTQLPKDYQYDDAKPRAVVVASTPFGAEVELGIKAPEKDDGRRRRGRRNRARRERNALGKYSDVDSRGAFAEWLTSPQNPRFTTVIANRMWKRVFGRGLIEPIDDIKDDTVPAIPALMTALEDLMVELDYDLLTFQRVLMHTRLFQRASAKVDPDPGVRYDFPGPVLRRLSAEQLWDSLLSLYRADVDETLQAADMRAEATYSRFERIASMTREELIEEVGFEVLRFTDPEQYREQLRKRRQERQREMQRARQEQMGGGQNRPYADEIRKLQRSLRQARRNGDKDEVAELQKEIQDLRRRAQQRNRTNQQMVRAAALQSPAPPGHFLRQFGQSDRESIENSFTDASVPQVLTLINGFKKSTDSLLRRELDAAKTPQAKIGVLYYSLLARAPSAAEQRMWLRDHQQYGDEVWSDLSWTLLNSHEFRFLR